MSNWQYETNNRRERRRVLEDRYDDRCDSDRGCDFACDPYPNGRSNHESIERALCDIRKINRNVAVEYAAIKNIEEATDDIEQILRTLDDDNENCHVNINIRVHNCH